jgi:outer membrane protein assembly factor BamA
MGGLSGLKAEENAITACLVPLTPPGGKRAIDDHGNVVDRCYYDSGAIRMSVGVGISWKSPFGLINIDLGIPILKEPYDQTQIFKFGFGTRFQ